MTTIKSMYAIATSVRDFSQKISYIAICMYLHSQSSISTHRMVCCTVQYTVHQRVRRAYSTHVHCVDESDKSTMVNEQI